MRYVKRRCVASSSAPSRWSWKGGAAGTRGRVCLSCPEPHGPRPPNLLLSPFSRPKLLVFCYNGLFFVSDSPRILRTSHAVAFALAITIAMLDFDYRIKRKRRQDFESRGPQLYALESSPIRSPFQPFQPIPEEVILRIFTYLAPDGGRPLQDLAEVHDLASLILVSRKCRRIVEPLMYRAVAISAGTSATTMTVPVMLASGRQKMVSFHIPVAQGCNVCEFLWTLRQRPDLIKYIKTLTVLRDLKASTLETLLNNGATLLPGPFDHSLGGFRFAAVTDRGICVTRATYRQAIREAISLLATELHAILQSLHNLTHLDLRRYRTYGTSDPFLATL